MAGGVCMEGVCAGERATEAGGVMTSTVYLISRHLATLPCNRSMR